MAKLISKTYGEALFELALEEKKLDELFEEAKAVRDILRENADFGKFMSHPKIPREDKVKVAEEVFKGRVSGELTGFLVLIIEKDRCGEMDAILTYFIDRVKEEKRIGVAFVTTAIALEEATKLRVKQRLLETTDYKEMEMHYTVDASIIGGMIIRIGDRVIDTSITTKLNELKKQLLKIQLG
jgi:F-type H+-transporting ATPase subunit delta